MKAQTTIDMRGMIGRVIDPHDEDQQYMNAVPDIRLATENTTPTPTESRTPVCTGPEDNTINNPDTYYNHTSDDYEYGSTENEYELDVTEGNNYNGTGDISTLDIVVIRRHILNTGTFDNGWQKVAGDFDLSGGISTLDIVKIRKYLLFGTKPNDMWVFLHAPRFLDNTFGGVFYDDPYNATWNGTGYPDYLKDEVKATFDNSGGYPADYDHNDAKTWFYAIQMGDVTWDDNAIVNDSAFHPLDQELVLESSIDSAYGYTVSSASLSMCTDRVEDEEQITIHVGVTNKVDSLCAFQLGLSIDSTVLDLISFREGDLTGYDSAHHDMVDTAFRTVYVDVDTNTITNLAAGDTLFSITLEATSTITDISDYITLEQNFLDNEIVLKSGTPGTISLSTLCSVSGSRPVIDPGNMQIQDKTDKIHLQIDDDISGKAFIDIHNVNGQLIEQQSTYFNAGKTQVNKSNVSSGIYVISVRMENEHKFYSQKVYLHGQ